MSEEKKEEGLFMRLARMEKQLAEKEGRDPQGWMWTEGMDAPRLVDFDAITEEESPDEQ